MTEKTSGGDRRRRRGGPGRLLAVISAGLVVLALVRATGLVWERGLGAFEVESFLRTEFVFVSGVPALSMALLLLVAFSYARAGRDRFAALWLAWALFLFGLVVSIPRGPLAVGWSVQPLIILLVTCTFGIWPGLAQATLATLALLLTAVLGGEGMLVDAPPDVVGWPVIVVEATVILAMALCGGLLHRTLHTAISAEEDQLHLIDQTKRALRHRENLLRHAMRVETVGEMSSMVVHQLRNQFQLIFGYTAIGMRKSADDAEVQDQFRAISATVQKSNELVESLLGMARTQTGRVETVDLTSLCSELAKSFGRVLPAAIELSVEVPDRPAWVVLDAQGFEHAILNLVLNARQAISGSGEIRLQVSVGVGTAEDGDSEFVHVEVRDTGAGIREEHLDDIFRPFFTTKEKGKGTGLGLAAVQRFVKSSNGRVRVESEPGVGTAFFLAFPLVARESLGKATG